MERKSWLWQHAAFALFLVILPCSAAWAGSISILNVDFNQGSPTTAATDATGVGFQAFDVSDSLTKTFAGLNSTFTSGAVTLTLSNLYDGNFRDRDYGLSGGGTMSGPFKDLYRDFVPFQGPNLLTVAITLSGLNANTSYLIAFQSFDVYSDHAGTTLFTDVTAGGATNGLSATAYFLTSVDPSSSITNFGSPSGGSASLVVRSNSLGQLAFAVADPTGSAGNHVSQINGLEIATPSAVPEPTSLLLFGIGLLALVGIRRTQFACWAFRKCDR